MKIQTAICIIGLSAFACKKQVSYQGTVVSLANMPVPEARVTIVLRTGSMDTDEKFLDTKTDGNGAFLYKVSLYNTESLKVVYAEHDSTSGKTNFANRNGSVSDIIVKLGR